MIIDVESTTSLFEEDESKDKIDEISGSGTGDTANVESSTKPEDGALTTSDTLLCFVIGMESCGNKAGQNDSTVQTAGEDIEDNFNLNSGECLYEGKIYQDFKYVASSNPCNLRYCSFGEVCSMFLVRASA